MSFRKIEIESLSDEEIARVIKLAVDNDVCGWLLWRLRRDYSDTELYAKAKEQLTPLVGATLLRNSVKSRVWNTIKEAMQKAGVACMPLKGCALIETYYPDKSLRDMSDIDFLVDISKVDEALRVIKAISTKTENVETSSFKLRFSHPHTTGMYWIGSVTLEMHVRLFTRNGFRNPTPPIEVKGDAMPVEYLLYHLTNHILYHKQRREGRIFLRWLIDIQQIFTKEAERTVEICSRALALNPFYASQMKEVWRRVITLLDDDMARYLSEALNITAIPIDDDFLSKGSYWGLMQDNILSFIGKMRCLMIMPSFLIKECLNRK
ncbi:MAG: nucleotidyltransferase family protein [Marinilabiliaceae bacterium]|nr:nucleotidyltransferase family protein [Marinilabiliaceae bacterium]